mgnify:FL=1
MKALEIIAYICFAIGAIFLIYLGVITIRYIVALKKEDASKTIHQLQLSVPVGIIWVVATLFFAVISIFPNEAVSSPLIERLSAGITFVFMESFGGVIACMGINWKIVIEEDCFYFTNTFGIKKQYRYDEIRIKYIRAEYRVYKGKRHIVGISYLQENYDALDKAKRAYDKSKK